MSDKIRPRQTRLPKKMDGKKVVPLRAGHDPRVVPLRTGNEVETPWQGDCDERDREDW